MTSDSTVACNHDIPTWARQMLRVSALRANVDMKDYITKLIKTGYEVQEKMITEHRGHVKLDDLMEQIEKVLSTDPKFKIVQQTISSFFNI